MKTENCIKKPFKASTKFDESTFTFTSSRASKLAAEVLDSVGLEAELRRLETSLDNKIRNTRRDIDSLKAAKEILSKYDTEKEVLELIAKWRGICQAGMAYMFNSTTIKINKMGGYEELRRREIEAEKRKIEYQCADGIQDEIDDVLESEDFKMLPSEEQQEVQERMNEKLEETKKWQQNQLERLELKLLDSSSRVLTMEELARRLKIDSKMVFPV